MATVTLNPSGDTQLISTSPTTNFNTSTFLGIGESDGVTEVRRSLIRFDLSSIPAGSVINSATLRLYCVQDLSTVARALRVYRSLRAWIEDQATWNVYATGNNWQTAGGFGALDCEQTAIGSRSFTASEAINVYKEWTLTPSSIQEMVNGTFANNGFLIRADTETNDAYRFNSNAAASNKPELVIVYTVSGRQFQAVIIG